jgi:hypothetical protein
VEITPPLRDRGGDITFAQFRNPEANLVGLAEPARPTKPNVPSCLRLQAIIMERRLGPMSSQPGAANIDGARLS